MGALLSAGPGILALILFVLVLVALELGYAVGRRRPASDGGGVPAQGVVLTIVGLLLGFMFANAAQRYDLRRDLTVREANAISTAYLRTAFVKEPAAAALRANLREYLDDRIALYQGGSSAGDARARSDALGRTMWTTVVTQPLTEPLNAHSTLVTGAVNDVLELARAQTAAFAARIPTAIGVLLFVVVTGASWLLGVGRGTVGHQDWIYSVTFAVLVSFVAYVIADLNQAERGVISTNLGPLIDLRSALK